MAAYYKAGRNVPTRAPVTWFDMDDSPGVCLKKEEWITLLARGRERVIVN
jgi:hypothetical protein